jgi:hypothetical protein
LDIAASNDDDINRRYKPSTRLTKHMPNSSLDSIPRNSPLLKLGRHSYSETAFRRARWRYKKQKMLGVYLGAFFLAPLNIVL